MRRVNPCKMQLDSFFNNLLILKSRKREKPAYILRKIISRSLAIFLIKIIIVDSNLVLSPHFQIISKIRLSVSSAENNLEDLASSCEGGEARQRAFPTSADADEEGVAVLHTQDALDPSQMLQRVVK